MANQASTPESKIIKPRHLLQSVSSTSEKHPPDEAHVDSKRHGPSSTVADLKPDDARITPPRTSAKDTMSDGSGSSPHMVPSIDDPFLSNQFMIDHGVSIGIIISGLPSHVVDESGLLPQASPLTHNLYSVHLKGAQLPDLPHNSESAISCYYKSCFMHSNSTKEAPPLSPNVAPLTTAQKSNAIPLLDLNTNNPTSTCLEALAASHDSMCSNLEAYLQFHGRIEQIMLGITIEPASGVPLLPPELLQRLASM